MCIAAGSEDWRRIEYPVLLTRTVCNYKGPARLVSLSKEGMRPASSDRLSGETFVCRRCKQLAYPSQRQQPWQRVLGRFGIDPGPAGRFQMGRVSSLQAQGYAQVDLHLSADKGFRDGERIHVRTAVKAAGVR